MKDKLTEKQTDAIIKALDETLENGPWDESNFLRVIGKNLRDIRDSFTQQVALENNTSEKVKMTSNLANRVALRSGQQEVFIALYSSEGDNIQVWEKILANLPRQVISRPIYADEEDVKSIIKTKVNKINEGYVSLYINQNDILPLSPDKTPVDKLGKPLLSLKNNAINLENVNFFVHVSGVYRYQNWRLIKNTNSE